MLHERFNLWRFHLLKNSKFAESTRCIRKYQNLHWKSNHWKYSLDYSFIKLICRLILIILLTILNDSHYFLHAIILWSFENRKHGIILNWPKWLILLVSVDFLLGWYVFSHFNWKIMRVSFVMLRLFKTWWVLKLLAKFEQNDFIILFLIGHSNRDHATFSKRMRLEC